MKLHHRWTFVLVFGASKRDYIIRIPQFVLVLMYLLVLLSCVSLINIIRLGISYSYSNLFISKQLNINSEAALKLRFLQKLVDQQSREIKSLTAFEDHVRFKYGMNPISGDVRKAGIGGRPGVEDLIIASHAEPVLKKAWHIEKKFKSVHRQVDLLSTTFSRMHEYARRIIDVQAQRPSTWPVRGRITSRFGIRFHPLFRRYMFHEGLDIANSLWTPIFATAAGIVTDVGRKGDMGNVVRITHAGSGYDTRYAHLVQFAVVEGQVVNRGDIIGYMGTTGRSTGCHLHYEVIRSGKHIDPLTCILPQDIIVD